MKPTVVLLEGDGIGPEIMEATVTVLERAGARITWDPRTAGVRALKEEGESLPPKVIDAIRTAGVALKGPIATPVGSGNTPESSFRSINVQLRRSLDLYANVRPIRSLPGAKSRYENVDLVIIRENTEGLYSGLEHEITPGVVASLKVSTRAACERIAEFAFRYAREHRRHKVTGVHKANILKLSDGLALECYREVARRRPDIEYDERIIDATAMSLVLSPEQFDILLMENLYGDIISDLAAGLIGGLGLAPSGNYGVHGALFEAVHGSAPDIAGRGIANPTALILSAVLLLRHLGQNDTALRIEDAVRKTYARGRNLTCDLGGSAPTKDFVEELCAQL